MSSAKNTYDKMHIDEAIKYTFVEYILRPVSELFSHFVAKLLAAVPIVYVYNIYDETIGLAGELMHLDPRVVFALIFFPMMDLVTGIGASFHEKYVQRRQDVRTSPAILLRTPVKMLVYFAWMWTLSVSWRTLDKFPYVNDTMWVIYVLGLSLVIGTEVWSIWKNLSRIGPLKNFFSKMVSLFRFYKTQDPGHLQDAVSGNESNQNNDNG